MENFAETFKPCQVFEESPREHFKKSRFLYEDMRNAKQRMFQS